MEFNENLFFTLLKESAQIHGPSLDESKRVDYLTSFLKENGIKFYTDEAHNIIILLNEKSTNRPIIFDAHIDIAGKGYSKDIHILGDQIKGQGCADNMTAAIMLILLSQQLQDIQLNKPFFILLSTGEEGFGNLNGIKTFIKNFATPPEMFVSFDLSFDTICLNALGSSRFSLEVSTPGGHSYEDYGKPNAAEILCEIVLKIKEDVLESIDEEITFNTGTITAGKSINIIAQNAYSLMEFRSTSPRALKRAEIATKKIITSYIKEDVQIEKQDAGSRPGALNNWDAQILEKILPIFKNLDIEPEIVPMSTNINATLNHEWPSFCTGLCSCGNFHTEEEFVKIDSLAKGWHLLIGLIEEFGIV